MFQASYTILGQLLLCDLIFMTGIKTNNFDFGTQTAKNEYLTLGV